MNNPTDIAQSEIDDLIRSEQDPRNRAMLLVLAKIASTLTDNTRLTREIGDRLEDHLTSYERKAASDADTQSRALGAWRVIAWLLGAAQVLAFTGAGWIASELKDLHKEDTVISERLTRIEASSSEKR
jgi:hypothetical protein